MFEVMMEYVCACLLSMTDGEINEQSSQSNMAWKSGLEAVHCHIDRVREITRKTRSRDGENVEARRER